MILRRLFSSTTSRTPSKSKMAAHISIPTHYFSGSSTAEEVLRAYGSIAGITNKNVFVTGATSGIGLETARAFAMSGATVWVAGRDVKKLQECVDGIKSTVSDPAKVHQILCDVSSLASVKRCVEEFKALNVPLHILINNAGCWLTGNPDRVLTEDGFEMHLGTNHIGHFALTNGLLPALTLAAPNARVVNVSSIAHARSAVDLNDPFYTKRPYDPFSAYGQSKTANILHAIGLHNRFHSEGITAVSLHPGVIDTELWRHGQIGVSHNKSIPQGAATQVWCAISPDVKSGYYYNDCNEAQARAWATDKASVDQFWEMSMQWTLEE